MDKYEYRVKTEQMLEYVDQKSYRKAMEIADTIDWKRVKNSVMLCTVSEIYEYNGEYQKSRDILFIAYDKTPGSRKIVYRLGTLALKLGEVEEALDCYDEFLKMAPKDPNQYILRYKILKAQGAPLQQQIDALEEFKRAEYIEKWAYELAELYHKAGMTAECLEECDDLILWFSEGKYVYKAMELKMKYKPLTPLQQEKYSHRFDGEQAHGTAGASQKVQRRPVQKKAVQPKVAEKASAEKAISEIPSIEEPVVESGITTTVSGATFAEAVARGVASAYAASPTSQETSYEEESISELTGHSKIEAILRQWEEKQRKNAEIIKQKRQEAEAAKAQIEAEAAKVQMEAEVAKTQIEAEKADHTEKKQEEESIPEVQETKEQEEQEIEEAVEQEMEEPVEAAEDEIVEESEDEMESEEESETEIEEEAEEETEAEIEEEAEEEAETEIEEEAEEEAEAEVEEEAEEETEAEIEEEAEEAEAEIEEEAEEEAEAEIEEEAEEEAEAEIEEEAEEEAEAEIEEEAEEEAESAKNVRVSGRSVSQDTAQMMAEDIREFMSAMNKDDVEAEEDEYEDEGEYEDAEYEYEDEGEYEDAEYEYEDEGEYEDAEYEYEDEDEYEDDEYEYEDEGEYEDDEYEYEDEGEYEDDEYEYEDEGEYEDDEYEYEDEGEYEDDEYEYEDEGEYEDDEYEYEDEGEYEDDEYEYEDEGEYEDDEYEYEDEGEYEDDAEGTEDSGDFDEDFIEEIYSTDDIVAEPEEEVLEIEEPSAEDESEGRKSRGGVSFDTNFIVQGRYDLSATSEIGLKAGLTEEQKQLFSYFVPVRGMSEQIVEVLENDKRSKKRYGTSRTGNILVIGHQGSGKTVLAVDLVKAIQKQRKIKQGKVAIVTGEALNKKDLGSIIDKLNGGALIIEKAGKLNVRTVRELNQLMEEQTGELLVVLEEQRKPMERMLAANPVFRKKFTSRVELPIFINDELVTFGQTYAKENGYRIDEMGILALYSRIDVLQREDHFVTVAEVKEIMDQAIEHAQKANVKHFMKRMFGKGTDESNRVILKEEDFKF